MEERIGKLSQTTTESKSSSWVPQPTKAPDVQMSARIAGPAQALQRQPDQTPEPEPETEEKLPILPGFGFDYANVLGFSLQAKLSVSPPDDPLEDEADRVADQVLRMPDPIVPVPSPTSLAMEYRYAVAGRADRSNGGQRDIGQKDVAQRSSLGISHNPFVQAYRQLALGPLEGGDQGAMGPNVTQTPFQTLLRKHAAQPVYETTMPLWNATSFVQTYRQEAVERPKVEPVGKTTPMQQLYRQIAVGKRAPAVGENLETQLQATRGGGSPLAEPVRKFMEPRFGADFSDVRVHTDDSAVQMSRDLRAQAFTTGQDIYFGAGKYVPESEDGKRLLAHELTHVVQQNSSVSAQRIDLRDDEQSWFSRTWMGQGLDWLEDKGSQIGEGILDGLDWVWGVIQGDFNEDPSISQIVVRAVITMIPGVDQFADIQDLVAALYKLAWQQRYDEIGPWFDLFITGIGLIPTAGSAVKGIVKAVIGGAVNPKLIDKLLKLLKIDLDQFIKKLPEYGDEAAKLTTDLILQIQRQSTNLAARLRRLRHLDPTGKMGQLADRLDEFARSLDEVLSKLQEKFQELVKYVQEKLLAMTRRAEFGVQYDKVINGKTIRQIDEEAGVLKGGKYIKNPTAKLVEEVLTEHGKLYSKSRSGKHMYVIDTNGNLIIGTRSGGHMPHPTLIGGENPKVIAAGEFYLNGGRIDWINNASGHFQPSQSSLRVAEDAFNKLDNVVKTSTPNGTIFSKNFQGYSDYGGAPYLSP